MKSNFSEYRGFTIEVSKVTEGGYTMLAYTNKYKWILVEEWNPSIKTVEEAIKECKITIDDYYANPEEYE